MTGHAARGLHDVFPAPPPAQNAPMGQINVLLGAPTAQYEPGGALQTLELVAFEPAPGQKCPAGHRIGRDATVGQ